MVSYKKHGILFFKLVRAIPACFPLLHYTFNDNVFKELPLIQNHEKLQAFLSSVFSFYAISFFYSLKRWSSLKKQISSVFFAVLSLVGLMYYLYYLGVESPDPSYDSVRVIQMLIAYVGFSFSITFAFATLGVDVVGDNQL